MNNRRPTWFIILLVIIILPVIAFPVILNSTAPDSELRLLAWFYPAYVIVSAICAYICYPDRREITWILLSLMLLTHLALLTLC